jgi:hypothetical protein
MNSQNNINLKPYLQQKLTYAPTGKLLDENGKYKLTFKDKVIIPIKEIKLTNNVLNIIQIKTCIF